MNPERTLLLIGHPAAAVRKAKDLGLDVIHLQHRSKLQPGQDDLADVTFLVDYPDWAISGPLAEVAHQLWGYSRAISLTDPGVEIAGRINDRYGLGGTGYALSHRFKNKWAMRRHLMDQRFPTVAARLVTGHESMRAFGAEYGCPFVVKPIDLAGGFGVFTVNDLAEVDHAWQQIADLRRTGMDRGPGALFTVGEFLMEEYVGGPEFSVEAFSFADRHVVITITEKLVVGEHFVEMGHLVPARINDELAQAIAAATVAFLDTIGLADGPSHTEFRVGRDGPRVIESHNRAGGDHIRDLVRSAYGFDFLDYAVGWPFRLVPELDARPVATGGACVRFIQPQPGMSVAAPRVTALRDRPDVLVAEADAGADRPIGTLRDNFDRAGLVAVSGPDSETALKLCEELIVACFDGSRQGSKHKTEG